MPSSEQAGAVLHIDLDALAANYTRLRREATGVACAAVIKADGYGLGATEVTEALWTAGCRAFFVAHAFEGAILRAALPDATIYVLHGPMPGTEADLPTHRLIPVLNSLEQIDAWAALARARGGLDAVLQIDTGMNRIGLPPIEVQALGDNRSRLDGIGVRYVMSHLACAEDADSPKNAAQLALFRSLKAKLPAAPATFANSSGIFLGPDYHFDLVRAGVALYGVNPTPGRPNPMAEVVRLEGRILQLREIDTSETVGYGAAYQATGPRRIATVPVGYADGYLRCLGNHAFASIGGVRVKVAGRVSMDLVTLDVTDAPPSAVRVGAPVDLIGGGVPVDEVAAWAGTIGYELLTSLGHRYHRSFHRGGS